MQTLCSASQVLCRERIAAVRRSDVSSLVEFGRARNYALGAFFTVLVATSFAQEKSPTSMQPESASVNAQLPVNWLYGAYIPKDVPLVALNGLERFKLYIRQTYTTPGIYIKIGFFALHDQVRDTPVEWEDGFSGFAKRVGSDQATNIIQNSFTSLGQGIVGWEPRYDRCRCTGELGHALATLSSETSSPMTAVNNPSGQTLCLLRRLSEREQSVQLGIPVARPLQLRDIRT
jgi:hypothetical protein